MSPMYGGPSSAPWRLYNCLSRVLEHLGVWFSCFCRFFLHGLDLPCSYMSSSLSLFGLPHLILVLVHKSLQLFPSVTKWRFHGDSWGIHQSNYSGRPLRTPYSLLLEVLAGVQHLFFLWTNFNSLLREILTFS